MLILSQTTVFVYKRSASSTSFSLREAKVPGNECFWERKFQRVKVPPMELSLLEWKDMGMKVPVTLLI